MTLDPSDCGAVRGNSDYYSKENRLQGRRTSAVTNTTKEVTFPSSKDQERHLIEPSVQYVVQVRLHPATVLVLRVQNTSILCGMGLNRFSSADTPSSDFCAPTTYAIRMSHAATWKSSTSDSAPAMNGPLSIAAYLRVVEWLVCLSLWYCGVLLQVTKPRERKVTKTKGRRQCGFLPSLLEKEDAHGFS
jgi:hypothetical protein